MLARSRSIKLNVIHDRDQRALTGLTKGRAVVSSPFWKGLLDVDKPSLANGRTKFSAEVMDCGGYCCAFVLPRDLQYQDPSPNTI
jgi:hypothetical protein